MDKLGAAGGIGGVCDLKYIKLPVIQDGYRNGTVTDCGDGMNPDMEKIIDLHPDAILLSPFENSGGYGRVEKLNIPIIRVCHYIWRLPLWGVPNGCVSTGCFWCCFKSRQPFAEVDSCYNQLRKRASLSSSSLSIVSELKSGSAWYVPGGLQYNRRLFNDACGRYAFAGR